MVSQMDKNKALAFWLLGVVAAMIVLSYASVPLYRIFCQMTGYDGTIQIGGKAPDKILQRRMTVSFDSRVDSGLPWEFRPDARKMDVQVGQQGIISFTATNISANQTLGTAVFNVTPDKAGKYFHKTQCFCFAEQALAGGKSAHFPVIFYVDPAIADDPEMGDVTDITLSYTFYAANSAALDRALSQYGQGPVTGSVKR